MKKYIILLLLTNLVISQQVTDIQKYDNGQIQSISYYKHLNNKLELIKISEYYVNGQMKNESNYRNGQLSGRYSMWHDSGAMIEQGSYKQDLKHGRWMTWHLNGKKETEMMYVDGKQNGITRHWDEQGSLQEFVSGVWLDSYDVALKSAEVLDLPIFINFAGHADENSRWMEMNIFSDSRVQEALDSFVLLRLYTDDRERGNEYMETHINLIGHNVVPCFIILSPGGEVIMHAGGIIDDIDRFILMVENPIYDDTEIEIYDEDSWEDW